MRATHDVGASIVHAIAGRAAHSRGAKCTAVGNCPISGRFNRQMWPPAKAHFPN
jgi:hypothetical protein